MTEKRLAVSGALFLLVVMVAAVFAMQRFVTSGPRSVDALPLPTSWDATQDLPTNCEDLGGTIRFDRSSECFTQPAVSDVCGFGVPCFGGEFSNYYCVDVKDPYCGCTLNAHCGEGFACDKTSARCYRVAPEVPTPYPSKEIYMR